jgi:hypothetical protein
VKPFLLISVEQRGRTPELNAVCTDELRAHLRANGNELHPLVESVNGATRTVFLIECERDSYLAAQCTRTVHRYGVKSMLWVDHDGMAFELRLIDSRTVWKAPAGMWTPVSEAEALAGGSFWLSPAGQFYVVRAD